MNRAYIISIRFNSDLEVANRCEVPYYSQNWIEDRLDIFNKYTRKSLEKQTNQDFTAVVSVHPKTMKLVETALMKYPPLPSNIIFTCQKDQVIEKLIQGKEYIYLIALDSDDMYHPKFIDFLHHYEVNEDTHLLQVNRGYVYNNETQIVGSYYSPASPFYTQIFRVEDYLSSIRYYGFIRHFYLQKFLPKIIDERLCMVILHGKNSWNKYREQYPSLFESKQILPNYKQILEEYDLIDEGEEKVVFVKRNWSQNAFENGSTLSQKFMTILRSYSFYFPTFIPRFP